MTLAFRDALNPEPGGLSADLGPAMPGVSAVFDQLAPDTQRACQAISCLAQHIATAQTAEVLERLSRLLERTNPRPVAPFVDGQFKSLEKAVLSHWRTEPCPCHLDTLGYLAHLRVRVVKANPKHPRITFRRGVNMARYRGALAPALHQLLIDHHQCHCDLCYDVTTFIHQIPIKSGTDKTALHKRIAYSILTMHPLLPLDGYEVDQIRDAIRLSQSMIVNVKG